LQRFANLLNQLGRRVAEELRRLMDMDHAIGFETHQSGAGSIGGDRIISQNDTPKPPRSSVERTIAFHRHDCVCDHKTDRNRGADIENASLNTAPVENVL
jgi:hypothetical protein